MTARGTPSQFEKQSIDDFLSVVHAGPAALVIEGEAGIGKTTKWLATTEEARRRGFRVLTARIGQFESVLAYATVADLLDDADAASFAELPEMQRLALDRILFRAGTQGPATDQWMVAAAFIAVVETMAVSTPVLMAIDDVQWLDTSSKAVLSFAMRRLEGRVGVLLTERCDAHQGTAASWLRMDTPGGPVHLRPLPLTVDELHVVITTRLSRSISRPNLVRIAEASAGNPLYAIELARAMSDKPSTAALELPGSLAELLQLRLGRLPSDVRHVLLAISCVAHATVDLLARATGHTNERVVELLEDVEADAIVSLDGEHVRFSHPLLATGVYADATPGRRRAMHRILAELEIQPELQARHLALATSSADDATLKALDAAADSVRARGAPAAAAELGELAISRGGDKPARRIRAGGDQFMAGETDRARALIEPIIGELRPGLLRAIGLNLLAAIHIYDNNFGQARELLEQAVDDAENVPPMLVQTLISLSFAQGMGSFADGTPEAGMFDESFRSARRAVEVAEDTHIPSVTSKALAMWVHTSFHYGHGVDEERLQRALELEDPNDDVPITYSAKGVEALIRAWTGRLDEAQSHMSAIRRHCRERGAEWNILNALAYSALTELWRGDLADASTFSEEAVARAQQLGGGNFQVIPLSARAAVRAHLGRVDEARADALAALQFSRECDAPRMAEWPMKTLGFIHLSLGDNAAAVAAFAPLVTRLPLVPEIELMGAGYVPDAAEALIAVDRRDQAEPLIEMLETNGRRLNRSWMLSSGARCRAMWLASGGDLGGAVAKATEALIEHDNVPMRFERARTVLLLGQLQRRRRAKGTTTTLNQSLQEFEQMGAALWAERARAEVIRTKTMRSPGQGLTPSERRVAELAASGLSNRGIAAKLFLSDKTVESHLTRIYRKLGIRNRAALVRRIDEMNERA